MLILLIISLAITLLDWFMIANVLPDINDNTYLCEQDITCGMFLAILPVANLIILIMLAIFAFVTFDLFGPVARFIMRLMKIKRKIEEN